MLEQEWFSLTQSAKILGVSRQTLWHRIKQAEQKRMANVTGDLKRGRDYRMYLNRWQLSRRTLENMRGLCRVESAGGE